MLALLVQRLTAEEAEAVRGGAERRLERYVQPDGSLAVPSSRASRSPCDATHHPAQVEWRGPDLNRPYHGFQPCALPTELPRPDVAV